MKYVMLLPYVHATFKAECKLQISFVAFKRTEVVTSPTCHSESDFGTAGEAVKLRIKQRK